MGTNTSTQTKKMNSYLATTLTLLLTLELGSCGHYYYKRPSKSVFNSLVSDSRFSTLVAAVTAAGLTEEAINDLGPLTVFAPTNEAFAKIPSDARQDREALQICAERRQCRRQQGYGKRVHGDHHCSQR